MASESSESASTKHLGWRIFTGAFVVTLALAAVVLSLHLVLDAYDIRGTTPAQGTGVGKTATGASSDTASVSASSVVAVLTPVIAGIVGVAGLFFGISATGSTRGRQAETEQSTAEAIKEAAVATQEAAKKT